MLKHSLSKSYQKNIAHFKKHSTLWYALLGLILVSALSYFIYKKISGPATPEVPPLNVQTVQVKKAEMPDWIQTIGSLSAAKELKIKAAVVGRVETLLVESGSWVKQGTLLLNIAAAPEVRAPFAGYITDWLVKPGEYVSPGTQLVDLVDTSTLLITFRVPEQFAPKLDIGQPVEVSVRAFPDKIFQGTVNFISPIIDKKTFTILIKAEVDNKDQELWPGMSAHIKQIFSTNPDALVIPEGALLPTLEGYEVFLVENNKIVRRKVTVGVRRNNRAQILSGLNLGDTIVIAVTDGVKEDAAVKAHPWEGAW